MPYKVYEGKDNFTVMRGDPDGKLDNADEAFDHIYDTMEDESNVSYIWFVLFILIGVILLLMAGTIIPITGQ